MKRKKVWMLTLCVLTVVCFSSCNTLRKFLSNDLEDEDFIIGQLYADEYYEEPEFKPVRNNRTVTAGSGNHQGTGIELNSKDNKELYAAIDRWYGTPYQYGGCTTDGVDCSCFVDHIYEEVYGVKLHRVAADIQKDVTLIGRNQLREGDVVFFTNSNGKVSHVGIYLKDDMFVHSSTSRGVTVSLLSNTYWNKHFYKGGRHKKVTTRY